MRLIDLDSLIVEFEKRCRGECCCCTEDYCGSGNDGCGCRVIDEAPTVDAVEVVRCKDCVEYLYCLQNEHNDPNGFCAWGKPREVEDEVTECTTLT